MKEKELDTIDQIISMALESGDSVEQNELLQVVQIANRAKMYYNKGVILDNLGNYECAIKAYNEAINANPNDSMTWYKKGLCLQKLGKKEEAIKAYDISVKLGEGLIFDDLENNNYNKKVAFYHQKIKHNPNNAEFWNNKGLALFNLGQYEDAIEVYNEAILVNPNCATFWYGKGNALYNLSRYEEAIRMYERAIGLVPDDTKTWYHKALSLSNVNRYKEAIDAYEYAIKLKPDLADAWFNKGIALSNLCRYKEAIDAYDTATKLKPGMAEAWERKGMALYNLGYCAKAVISYEHAIKLKPDVAEFWNNKGLALKYLWRNEDAIIACDQAIKLKPDLAEAWNNKGLALYDLDLYKEALISYEKAIELNANIDAFWNNKGLVLYALGSYEEAIKALSEAITFNHNYAIAYCSRAKVYKAQSKNGLALNDLREAYEILDREYSNNLSQNSIEFQGNIQYIKESLKEILILDKILQNLNDKISIVSADKAKLLEGQEIVNNLSKVVEDFFTDAVIRKIENSQKKSDIQAQNPDDPRIYKLTQENEVLSQQLKQFQIWYEEKVLSQFRNDTQVDNNTLSLIFKTIHEEQDLVTLIKHVQQESLEPYVFKVSKEISGNSAMNDYYNALYDKLNSAMNEADIITSGKLTLDISDIKVKAFSVGLSLIPVIGKYIAPGFETVTNIIKSNTIKDEATKFKNSVSLNPDDRKTILKQAAEKIALTKAEVIQDIEYNEEVLNWIEKGLIAQCKDFFIVNMNNRVYENKPQILGCIDALKIMLAINTNKIKCGKVEEVVEQLVQIPNLYIFSKKQELVIKSDISENSVVSEVLKDSKSRLSFKELEENGFESKNELLLDKELLKKPQEKTCYEKIQESCIIYSLTEITYDNPILNYPQILQKLTNNLSTFGFLQVVDIVGSFDKDFVKEVCMTGNIELLQECFSDS